MNTDTILAPVAALQVPDSALLQSKAQRMLAFVEAITINDQATYELAASELQALKGRAKEIEGQRTSITGPLNDALRAVNSLFRGPGELFAQAEAALKRKMLDYTTRQERIAAEARAKAEAEAAAIRKAAEDEAIAKAREAQAAAEAAAKAQAEGDQASASLAQAATIRAQAEASAAMLAAQLTAAPAAPVAAVAQAKGISTTTKLEPRVVNLLALVQHVAANPELIGLLAVDSVRLRAYAKGLGAACNLPGVAIEEVKTMSARRVA